MKNKVIAFIPMRSGSKGIKDKNIKIMNGKPLFFWTISVLIEAKIPKIVVSTDSLKYAELVKSFFNEKVDIIFRSKENSSDKATTENTVLEYLNYNKVPKDNYILLTQITSPLIKAKDISSMIFYQNCRAKGGSVISVVDISNRFLWDEKGKSINYDYLNRSLRQDFKTSKKFLVENGAFYLNSVENWLKYKNRLTKPIFYQKMCSASLFEIDTIEDWKNIESLLEGSLEKD